MAIVKATKTGVWSDSSVWSPSAPTSSDDVYSNTFTVTIDTSPTVLSISNAATTGVTAGGTFVPTNGITLTCTASTGVYGISGSYCFNCSLPLGQSCTLSANCVAGFASGTNAAGNTGAGTLIINGNCSALGASNGGIGAVNASTGILNINGNCTGANTGSFSYGASNKSTGTLNLVGNAIGVFGTGYGVINENVGTVNITGICSSTSTAISAFNSSGGTMNLTGTANGGTSSGSGIQNATTGIVNVIGNVIGGTSSGYGAYANSTGTLTITGTVQATTTAAGVGGVVTAVVICTGPFLTASNGANPNTCARWFWQNTSPPSTYYQIRSANLSVIRPLYTADSVGGNPAVANVRSGTVYGPASELTGTCAVPSAASVVVGAAVDNTVGTAAITAATIRSAVGLASASLDTQLAAIPTTAAPSAATISTSVWAAATRTLTTTIPSASDIANAVWANATRTLTAAVYSTSDIATAIWAAATRTITGGTVDTLTNAPTVPSASTIATAVRSELTTELGRIDVATSSRLAPAGTLARVTLTDTATTLTNAPTVPTAAQIATATRSELATEMARLDVATSTRLASSAYTTPPTAAAITSAVWAAADKSGYNLTETERTAISTAVQAGILNESDGQAILNAIVGAIGNTNVDQVALVAAIRTDLERTGGALATRLAASAYTTPPTAAATATAVRSELSPELARVSNCATVQNVASIVEGALALPAES